MRQIVSTAVTAVIVSLLTLTVAGVLAQTPEESAITPSAVRVSNADRVDGKHAVSATKKLRLRAGKLVATNKYGMLPPNIVKPYWGYIKNKPAGFADGIDNEGVTQVHLTKVSKALVLNVGHKDTALVRCPTGAKVTGGGFSLEEEEVMLIHLSSPDGDDGWKATASNLGTEPLSVTAYAICMSVQPANAITTASRKRG